MQEYKKLFVTLPQETIIIMEKETKQLNRLKVVLAEKNLQNKWLAEQLGRDQATVSKWVTNSAQPNIETLMQIARLLEVQTDDLLRFDELPEIAEQKVQ